MNLQVITRATIALMIAVAVGATLVSGQDSKPVGDKVSFLFVQISSSGSLSLSDIRPGAAVVVLSNPVYTAKQNKLTYDVKVVGESTSKFHQTNEDVKTLPGQFKTTSLFIDGGCFPWDPRC
jgi:outer membrane murein-binding lipoprotein Lpp